MSSPRKSRAPFDPRTWLAALRSAQPQDAYERGVAALDAGRLQEAFVTLGDALNSAVDDGARVAARNKRGVVAVGLGRRAEALEDFHAALALDARYAPALVNLGNLSLEDGRIDEAIEYYQAALRADDQYSGAHRNMGIACKRIGRHADAVRHLRIATRLEIRQAMKRRR